MRFLDWCKENDCIKYNEEIEIVVASCSSDESIKRVNKNCNIAWRFIKNSLNKKILWIHIGINKKSFQKKYEYIINKYKNLNSLNLGVIPNIDISTNYRKYKPTIFVSLLLKVFSIYNGSTFTWDTNHCN